MKKLLLILPLALLLILPLISLASAGADDPDFTFKQVTQVDLKRPCFNNGTWCSGAAICNMTIQSPNGNNLITNVRMTNQVSFHNVTLSRSQTVDLGTYTANMVCSEA